MQSLAGREFAYVGVNSDEDREFAKQRAEEAELSWVNIWNGPKGTRGPLAKVWGVNAWPSTFLLDRSGKIRYRGLRGRELRQKIELLLAEASPR